MSSKRSKCHPKDQNHGRVFGIILGLSRLKIIVSDLPLLVSRLKDAVGLGILAFACINTSFCIAVRPVEFFIQVETVSMQR